MTPDLNEFNDSPGVRAFEARQKADCGPGEVCVPGARCSKCRARNIAAYEERTIVDQPPPLPNNSQPVWDLVIADMCERDKVGRFRYGTPLQPFNGRDALVDAYQEALDLVVYLRQAIAERDTRTNEIHHPARELPATADDAAEEWKQDIISRFADGLALEARIREIVREELATRGAS